MSLSTTFPLGSRNRRHSQEVEGAKRRDSHFPLWLCGHCHWLQVVAIVTAGWVILNYSSLDRGNTLSEAKGLVNAVNTVPFQHIQIELPQVSHTAGDDAVSGLWSRTLRTFGYHPSSFCLFQIPPRSFFRSSTLLYKLITHSLHLILSVWNTKNNFLFLD